MELKNKDINKVKESINKLNNLSQNEKRTLIDSIEMLWLNAGVQKKNLISIFRPMLMKISQE